MYRILIPRKILYINDQSSIKGINKLGLLFPRVGSSFSKREMPTLEEERGSPGLSLVFYPYFTLCTSKNLQRDLMSFPFLQKTTQGSPKFQVQCELLCFLFTEMHLLPRNIILELIYN